MLTLLAVALYLHVSDALAVHAHLYGQTMRCRFATAKVEPQGSTQTVFAQVSFFVLSISHLTQTFNRILGDRHWFGTSL
jgi:hypothetical protein